jgi:tRNA U34 5-carboxymethylaminomethyl modifying GTPase MnmE/TrmE
VFDASQPWTTEDQQLCETYPGALVVHNKIDLASGDPRPAGPCTCATNSSGVDQVIAAVTSRLVPVSPPPQTPIPFTRRQVTWLQAAAQAVRVKDAGQIADCLDHLLSSEQLPA